MNNFDKAIEYLKVNGWTQGHMYAYHKDGRKSACIMGAFEQIYDSYNGMDAYYKDLHRVEDVVREQFPERISDPTKAGFKVAIFNDDRDTTYDDVIMVLEKASIKWDETHGTL